MLPVNIAFSNIKSYIVGLNVNKCYERNLNEIKTITIDLNKKQYAFQ